MRFVEQVMSQDISQHILAPNGGYCVIILQIFFTARAVLKIRESYLEIQ